MSHEWSAELNFRYFVIYYLLREANIWFLAPVHSNIDIDVFQRFSVKCNMHDGFKIVLEDSVSHMVARSAFLVSWLRQVHHESISITLKIIPRLSSCLSGIHDFLESWRDWQSPRYTRRFERFSNYLIESLSSRIASLHGARLEEFLSARLPAIGSLWLRLHNSTRCKVLQRFGPLEEPWASLLELRRDFACY